MKIVETGTFLGCDGLRSADDSSCLEPSLDKMSLGFGK
eukprot:CAMPEP_0172470112 /NCGR_PEP_ID=MMETSP1065-20121228/65521_1 /TAXON_ID=265537 /ORGANISM="Amphiprora paludosa, Strain CCMP125" /LENGTH=37 /DNA_ID= /DNA_START= /DNA_END= /DNA_ORIENTATION=